MPLHPLHLRARWLVAFATGLLACKQAPAPAPRAAPTSHIPADAALVVLATTPATLEPLLSGPLAQQACAAWPAAPIHPCAPERWGAAGLDTSSPAALFVHEDRHALIAAIAHPPTFAAWLNERRATALEPAPRWLVPGDEAQAALLIVERDGLALITEARDPVQAAQALDGWLALGPGQRWDHLPEHRAMARTLAAEHPVFAIARPAYWLTRLPAQAEQATLLRDLLVGRAGLLGVGLRGALPEQPGAVGVTLLHHEDTREPDMIDSLGHAAEPLPAPGSILSEDTAVALHMAFEPQKLWTLWRSTLEPDQRRQLDALVESLREDFMLDLEQALIHNAQGHVILAVSGLQPGLDKLDGIGLLRAFATLSATQELLVIPLHDGRRMARALDIFTTLSRGALRRQSSGELVQYVLFEDGELERVFIVHQDDLLIADSASSLELARTYAAKPRKRAAPQPAKSAPSIMAEALSSTAGLGLAIQTGPLRALVPTLPAWIEDITSITAHTVPGPDAATERVNLVIRFAPAHVTP